MAKLGVEPVPQPVFIYDFGDLYLSVLEPERVHASYPMRDWMNAGMKPAASSDAPVCDANIWPNIYTMLTRKTSRGTVVGPDQTMTIDEVIAAYTDFGAYVNRCERPSRPAAARHGGRHRGLFSRSVAGNPGTALA